MPSDRFLGLSAGLYRRLLRLYPPAFHRRFGESMAQTFADLCRERREAGGGLFAFVVQTYLETFVGIVKERMRLSVLQRSVAFRPALVTVGLLMIPLGARMFTDEVAWSGGDFLAAGILLFGSGLAYEAISRRAGNTAYRAATALAVGTALFLVWSNLAVGILGSEDNPANVLYLAVLATLVLGASMARLRPAGMARTLFATAGVHALVPVAAMMIFKPAILTDEVVAVVGVNGLFVVLFVASGLWYRHAEAERSEGRPA